MTVYSCALFITGNPGCGKSYIANNLGATFESGFSVTGAGVTTDVQYAPVLINGQRVLMVDAPGLIEADLEATQRNAIKITEALQASLDKDIPYKIGVIVADNNGRIQASDLLLIKKVHDALIPKFEMLLIVNQIKQRNLRHYASAECIENLVETIRKNTGAHVSTDRVIAVEDYVEGEVPNMMPLKNMLKTIDEQTVKEVSHISISEEEFETIGEKILFYTFATVAVITAPIWGIPYLIYKAIDGF